jgi:hypothetical protein
VNGIYVVFIYELKTAYLLIGLKKCHTIVFFAFLAVEIRLDFKIIVADVISSHAPLLLQPSLRISLATVKSWLLIRLFTLDHFLAEISGIRSQNIDRQ